MLTPEVAQLKQYLFDKQSTQKARALWERALPIKGTPAERYIVNTRRIPLNVAEHLQIKSLRGPIGIPEFDNNKPNRDYVVVPVYNLDDEFIGLQIIQLDSNGEKATHKENSKFYCKKYLGPTHPMREGKAAVVNKTDNVDVVFVAEGIETAASIASLAEIGKNYSVLASMGVNQLPATLAYIKTHYPPGATVVLLKDHDETDSPADSEFKSASSLFTEAGYKVIVKEPAILDEDWNDILVNRGLGALASEFDLNNLDLPSKESAHNSDKVSSYFDKIYRDLLKSEKLAEEKALLLLLNKVIEQLIVRLEKIDASSDFQNTLKDLNRIVKTIDLVHLVLTDYDQLPAKPAQLKQFKRAVARLIQIEESRRNSLKDDEEIDHSIAPRDNSNGDLFKAYSFAMHHCQSHLKSLETPDIEALKKEGRLVEFHERSIARIQEDIKSVSKWIAQFSRDKNADTAPALEQLKSQLKNLQNEKRFHTQALARLKKSLPLMNSGRPKRDSYGTYHQGFIEQANTILLQGEVAPSRIRKAMTDRTKVCRQELQEDYRGQILTAQQNCIRERKLAIPLITKHLEELRRIIQLNDQQIERQSLLPECRDYQRHYLNAMDDLGEAGELATILQRWLNNLAQFKTALPLIYQLPMESETAQRVTLIDDDSDVEETLDDLYGDIYGEDESTEEESKHQGSDKGKEIDRKTDEVSEIAASLIQLLHLDEGSLDKKLALSIRDFAERLAVNLYKSFEIIAPQGKERQEFDGLALRGGRLTIIERKTNNETGPGLFQRNFCQQKIVSKQAFVLKSIASAVLGSSTPEEFIDIEIPGHKDWYSDKFTATMQESLVFAAKSKVVEALKNMTVEFTVNRPAAFKASDYDGLFFNPRLLRDVSLRFSKVGKGDEDEAHRLMEETYQKRAEDRKSAAIVMDF